MLFKHKYPFNCCCFYIQGCRRYFYVLLLYISEYIWKKLYSNIMDIRNNSSVSKALSSSYHRVVTDTQESHHFYVSRN